MSFFDTVIQQNWRLTLSDETRKSNVGMLFKAFELLNLKTNTRFIVSKKWEDEAYNKAYSIEEYNKVILGRLAQLKHKAQQQLQNQQTASAQLQDTQLRVQQLLQSNQQTTPLIQQTAPVQQMTLTQLQTTTQQIAQSHLQTTSVQSPLQTSQQATSIQNLLQTSQQTTSPQNLLQTSQQTTPAQNLLQTSQQITSIRQPLQTNQPTSVFQQLLQPVQQTAGVQQQIMTSVQQLPVQLPRLQFQGLGAALQQATIGLNSTVLPPPDWRLTFSNDARKANITMLFNLLEPLMHDLTTRQRLLTSKKMEDDAYSKANSEEEYNQAISGRMSQFGPRAYRAQLRVQQEQQQIQQATAAQQINYASNSTTSNTTEELILIT